MLAQVVAAHKPLVAHRTREALLTGVRAQVPLELVGARKPLAAEQPIAHERPLTSVPPQVRLQVRRFAIHLTTARDVAAMQAFPPQAGARRSQSFSLLAVRAVAGGSARISPGGGPRGAR